MKKVVWLRIYKGQEILKKQDGSIKNENQIVKLTHETMAWSLYINGLKVNPYCKVEVEKVMQPKKDEKGEITYTDIEIPEEIKKEVKEIYESSTAKVLTPEQRKIAELQERLDSLEGKGNTSKTKGKKESEKKTENDDAELEGLRVKYREKFGKKPHHMMKAERIKEELAK